MTASTGPTHRVTVERDGPVAVLEFADGPANHISTPLVDALADRLEELAGGDCRAVVLCSPGDHFCAGAKLAAGAVGGLSRTMSDDLYRAALRVFAQPLPLVAAVQGAAVGGGLGLALAADFRVVAPKTKLWANFARLGTHHGFGLTVSLPRLVGPQHTADLLLRARPVRGEEAVAIGLADRVVTGGTDTGADDVRASARELAAELAEGAPLAVRAMRATLRSGLLDELTAAVDRESRAQGELMSTADFREGVAAVSERRAPAFTGT